MIRAFALLAAWAATTAALAAPTVLWVSDPVRPDETVLLLTEGASVASVVEAVRLADTKPTKPGTATALPAQWTTLKPLQAARQCVKVILPAAWKPGVFALRVREGKALSGVAAVQTLSRLNRTAPGKDQTFVLDFANSAE